MAATKSFTILGGDLRQKYLLSMLKKNGYSCNDAINADDISKGHLSDMIHDSSYILAPIPLVSKGHINGCSFLTCSDLETYLHNGQHIFCGKMPSDMKSKLTERKIICHDYMEDDEIAIYNSIATAEGIIADIITSYPGNLYKSRILVLGYGKCAMTLCDKLNALGCITTVCARRVSALATAHSLGNNTLILDELMQAASDFDIIINTIPSLILTEDILKTLNKNTYLYDIASTPGGIDFKAAGELHLHATHHLSIPGKYAPLASAQALFFFIIKILKENSTLVS